MLLRLVFGLWYVFFVGKGAVLGAGFCHLSLEHQQLSATCLSHSCACSYQGFCRDQCCCSAAQPERTTEASVYLTSCNPGDDVFTPLDQPHLITAALKSPTPTAFGYPGLPPCLSWREGPGRPLEKIPIIA